MRTVLLLLLGAALLGAAVYLTHAKVVAIKVGEHTSRLVGVFCMIVAYYYFRHSFAVKLPTGEWTTAKWLETLRTGLPPVVLFGAAGFYAITIFRNWRSEFIELLTSTAWIAVVVALVVAARFVLMQ